MDLSALIFVALAVAWAAYLIPKALRHHEDSSSSRSVEGFSARLRVLARREPAGGSSTRLVVGEAKPEVKPVFSAEAEVAARPRPVPAAVRRQAAARAARRRLRVVLVILLGAAATAVGAYLVPFAWTWMAVPGGVLLAWLVACRLMVKRERASYVPTRRLPLVVEEPAPVEDGDLTEEIVAVAEVEVEVQVSESAAQAPDAPGSPEVPTPSAADEKAEEKDGEKGWDPVPTTLPTYVGKEPARRSVRQIDLDSTGVWTSGQLASDSAIAREAEEAERSARAERSDATDKNRRAN